HVVGNEVAAVHVGLRLLTELRALLHRGTKDVAGRVVGQVEVRDETLSLGPLPGPRRTEQNEVQLAHSSGEAHRDGGPARYARRCRRRTWIWYGMASSASSPGTCSGRPSTRNSRSMTMTSSM